MQPGNNLGKKMAIAVGAGLLVFTGLAFFSDIEQVGRALTEFRLAYLPLILGFTALNYALRFVKWHYYLGCLGIPLQWPKSVLVFLSGLTMSVTPAKLGELFKSYLLKELEGVQISRTVPVVFAERLTDVLGLLALAALSFSALWYGPLPIALSAIVIVALIAVIQSRSLSLRLVGFLARLSCLRGVAGSLYTAYESAHSLVCPRPLAVAVLLSIVSWGFECVAFYFVLKGLGVDVPLVVPTFVFSFSSIAGTLSMIPGGLIAAEGSMTGLLMLDGIRAPVAAAATVVIRLCTLWFGVAVGLLCLAFTMRYYRRMTRPA